MKPGNNNSKGSNTHCLDLHGTFMPFSLLKFSQALRGIEPGALLEVLWSDPDTPADLFKVLPDTAYMSSEWSASEKRILISS
ncbi:MAG: hypothetical protein WAK95_05190 [Desulfobacterales bacterium]